MGWVTLMPYSRQSKPGSTLATSFLKLIDPTLNVARLQTADKSSTSVDQTC